MRKLINRHSNFIISIILVILILFIVFSIIYSLSLEKSLPIILSILTLYVSMNRFKISIDNQILKLFKYFNYNYDKMNEILKNIMREPNELNYEHRDKIEDYLNLCAEEFYWFKKGIIDNTIWEQWFNGARYYFNNSEKFKKVLLEERNANHNKNSYYGFLDLNILIDDKN